MEEITYVGHILSSAGVRPNPEKVSVVKNFPTPKNVKQLRQFLALSQYYRRFQKNFAQISKPLYDLTRKDVKWDWTEEREKAFQTLKNNLITPPILAYPDPNRPYIISIDASTNGLGYVLSQKDEHNLERVIAYSGRALRKAEKNYSITELEALSVVAAFKQFHPYIYGNFVTLRTDHKALQYIYKNKTSKGRLMRWVLELMNYDYEIEHKPGIHNGAADAISRLPEYPKSTENQPEIPGDPHIMSVSTANFENEVSSSERKLQKFDWLQVSIFDDGDDNVDINMFDSSDEYCFDIKRIDIIAEQNLVMKSDHGINLSKLAMFHLMLNIVKQNCLLLINMQLKMESWYIYFSLEHAICIGIIQSQHKLLCQRNWEHNFFRNSMIL